MRVSGHKIESLFHEIIAYPEKRRGILEGLEAGERLQLEKWLEFDAKAESGRLFEPLKTLDVSESARGSLPSRIGNYRIEGLLGEGGMGVVYKALHIHLKTYVALKVLPAKRLLSESAVKRFELEMAAVGLLSHPNLVHATDAGNDENQYYIALEFVDGTDAAQIVRPDGKLSISNACDLVRQAALGLAHAHDNGLIHRDVKPSNLLVSATGVVKVADMGLAQLQNQSDAGLTESGQIMGTLDYISPEQIEKPAQANASSDLYSLGCTLYQLLSGKPPFSKPEFETPLQKMRAHDQQTPVALVDSAEGIPKELSELTNELLTKNPVDRLSSGEELARRLEPYCQDADLGGLVKRVARSREHELSTDRIRFEKLETQVLLPSSRGSSKTKIVRGVLWAVACVFVALAAWNAQALIRIATNKGVLVVENFDGVDVSIVQGERPLVIRDKVTKREYSLGVGDDYRILIRETGTGVEYTSEQFSITRNQETVFDVRAELASRLATDVADLNNPSANAMSSNGARTEADLSVSRDANLDFLRWGFGHGVFRFQAYDNVGRWFDVSNLKKLPSGNLSRLRSARLFVRNLESDPKRIEEILTKVPDSIDVDVLHLEGSAPSKPALEAISSNAALRNVRFYGCFDFDALEKMPVGCFKYVEILLLWEVMLSEDLKSIASHFPNLKKLNVCELPAQGVDVLLDLPLEFLVLNVDEYSEAQPELNDLSILTNIRELVLAFSSKLTQEPVTDFEKLPPNLSSLELHNFSLTAENFDQLQRYAQLESVKTEYSAHASRSPPAIDQQLVESFQQRRSDVFLDLYDPSGASKPSSADESPVHAIAAFDNGKGFSYVFYSNGLYDKVINATDQVYHQLETEYFWSHSVEHRSPLMLAA
ncbi:MAG: serine/threonine protein kinase, partial [Pirellulaceae bacterium]